LQLVAEFILGVFMEVMQEKKSNVRTELREGVLVVTLDAPSTGNALDVAMTSDLSDALEKVNGIHGVRCVLLTSSGKHFCTGGNVKDMQSGQDLMAGTVGDVRDRLRLSLHRITRAMDALEVPSIAAVNGAAVGAGFDLTLMCDIRLAADSAQFSESFLRLGLVSGIGGAWYLTRLVGASKAMEMTLTSEFFNAQTALQLGIVSRVVSAADLADAAFQLASTIASGPPNATRMAKRLVRDAASVSLPTALEQAASLQAMLLCGEEHKAAVHDFLERRSADKERSVR
jgi:enoyl-CoA hydratase/carnithine racemase